MVYYLHNQLFMSFLCDNQVFLAGDNKGGFFMTKLNLSNLKAVNEVFKRLNILRRWSSYVTEDKYNELAKQSLNCIVTYMLASYCEKAGKQIRWELFPKIALYRAFQKVYVYFDRPEYIIDEICQMGNIEKDAFFNATRQIISELTDDEFSDFISQGIGTYEMQIYRVATKIATLIELVENQYNIKEDEYNDYLQKNSDYLENYLDMPGVKELKQINSKIFQLLQKISKLRNQTRWSVMSYTIECPVLGHLFDTAIFGYFSVLEQFSDEQKATEMFWQGIFHDIPETWTGDFPSPIKKMIPHLRESIKMYEEKMLEQHFYASLPNFISDKIRELLAKEEQNPEFRKYFKGADYLSADSECYRQYHAGTRDTYFFEIAIKNFDKELCQGTYMLSTTCLQLHQYFYSYVEKCVRFLI